MSYKLAIFDLDGTILDTLGDLAASTNAALAQFQLPARSEEEVRGFVGNGIRRLIERAVPEGTEDSVTDQVFAAFQAHYREHCKDRTRPYAGIPEVLDKLRRGGVRMAVVSNKADFEVQKLCAACFPGMFELVVGEREGIRRKPYPDSVNEVLHALSVEKAHAVYIGDTDVDIRTAENAGIPVLSVSWGFRDADFLREHGASRILARPEELTPEICGNF